MSARPSAPRQGDIWWTNLDPTVGREISKKRPCLIVSPDEMNLHLGTVIAAPITSTLRDWPTRLPIRLSRTKRSVALDQVRMIDNSRLMSRITRIDPAGALGILREMFV